jgi:hypothetical protein
MDQGRVRLEGRRVSKEEAGAGGGGRGEEVVVGRGGRGCSLWSRRRLRLQLEAASYKLWWRRAAVRAPVVAAVLVLDAAAPPHSAVGPNAVWIHEREKGRQAEPVEDGV